MKGRYYIFTILELLVVIAIISILASILLPALKRAKETSEKIQCSGNLRQNILALESYLNDSNDYYPPFFQGSPTTWTWNYALRANNYVTNNMIQFCPSGLHFLSKIYSNPSSSDNCVRYPERVYDYDWTHYGYNYVWFGSDKGLDYEKGLISASVRQSSSNIGLEPVKTMKRGNVKNSSMKIVLADTVNSADITRGYYVVHTMWASENSYIHGRHGGQGAGVLAETSIYGIASFPTVCGVGGSANFAWADGHVSNIPKVTTDIVFSPVGMNQYWNPNR